MNQLDIYFISLEKEKENILNFFKSFKQKNIKLNYSFDPPDSVYIVDRNFPSFYIYHNDEMISCSSHLNDLRKKISYAKCYILFKQKKFPHPKNVF